jgi:hypothetical protein
MAETEIGSPKLKRSEARFLLLTELGTDRMTGEMNSEMSIPYQPHTDEKFTLQNPIAFVSIASRSLQGGVQQR